MRARLRVGGKTRRRLNRAGRADRDEQRRSVELLVDSVQVVRHLAEPANVRANPAAAFTSRKRRWRIVGVGVVKRRQGTAFAAAFEEFAVHVDRVTRASLFVEIVHILCTEEEPILQAVFERRQRGVTRVWFRCGRGATPHGIEFPHELRIAVPCVRRCDFFDAPLAPEAARAAERRKTTFGADSRAREDKHAVGE